MKRKVPEMDCHDRAAGCDGCPDDAKCRKLNSVRLPRKGAKRDKR